VFPEPSTVSGHEVEGVDFFHALASVLPGVVYQSRISPDGVARVEYVSDAARWMLECEPADIIRDVEVFRRLIHPDDREMFNQRLAAQLQTAGFWQLEYRLLLPSGRVRWISSQASISAAPGGETLWCGFFTDITERKCAENELNAERERLALATRAGRIGTWDYDVRTKGIRWNEEMYAIHGVTPENYTPGTEKNFQFLSEEDQARVWKVFEECLASPATHYAVEVTINLPSGEKRLTRSQALILREASGEAIRVVGIEVDITEEKQAETAMARAVEAAEQADRAKSEFLATMSHEIRTPMNGILGYTELLKTAGLTGEQRTYLESIEASGEHLLAVINDVLDVSRIEAGGMRIESAAFDVRDCVTEVFEMLRPVAAVKSLDYCCAMDPNLPPVMVSDRRRVVQVLTNVLGNAIKFTDDGEVRLSVAAELEDGASDWQWEFRVADSGPGIAPKALAQIFQPFYQVDSSAGRRHGGTGLGLTISKRLAEMLGGTLTVENRSCGGSEFTFILRAAGSATSLITLLAEPSPEARVRGRLLVAEDNSINRKLCEIQLQRIGCEMQFVLDGQEALDAFSQGEFDLVLMDMQMPGMDGCAATREIRQLEQSRGGRRTPIIAMTANVRAEDEATCRAAGMDDFLSKPLSQECLAAMLEKWLSREDRSSPA